MKNRKIILFGGIFFIIAAAHIMMFVSPVIFDWSNDKSGGLRFSNPRNYFSEITTFTKFGLFIAAVSTSFFVLFDWRRKVSSLFAVILTICAGSELAVFFLFLYLLVDSFIISGIEINCYLVAFGFLKITLSTIICSAVAGFFVRKWRIVIEDKTLKSLG